MLRYLKEKDFVHPFVIWLIIFLWYLIVADKIFFTPQINLDNFITAQSFWLLSEPPKQLNDITIVTIDEASRRDLGLKWPWKRGITAKLIRNIASFSPKVIALDIIFSGSSEEEEDKKLLSALQSHPRIVLGYVLRRNSTEKPAQEFIDAVSSLGFVNRPLQEGIVNKIRTFYVDSENNLHFSMDIAILQDYFGLDKEDIEVNASGISLKDELFIPSPEGTTRLNYLVFHSGFTTVPASSVLEGTVSSSKFKDKIVLVGATDPIIHDEFSTPLGIFSGVTILGNSLVMLLSKRFIHTASVGQSIIFAFFIGFFIIFINKELEFFPSSLFSFLLLALSYFSFIYLRSKDITLPYFTILFSGTTAYASYNLYKYTNLIYMGNRLKNQAIRDPLTGLYTRRFFLLQLDEKVKLGQNLFFVGLRIVNYQRLSMDLSFDEIKLLVRHFSSYLKAKVDSNFKKASISCLATDTLGVFVEGEKMENIEVFLKDLLKESKDIEWELGSKKIVTALRACIIFVTEGYTGKKCDIVYQMEGLFKTTENEIGIEELEEVEVGEQERTVNYRDVLDFIAYDWEERNKDLESALSEVLGANQRLEKLNLGTLTALARAIDAKSPWTAGHSERVTEMADKIGHALGLTHNELKDLHKAGLLHDIGKIGIPAEILNKPGKLTDEEYRIITEHPRKGERILNPIEDYARVIPMAMQHHEWFNGKGYPDNLAGEDISLGGRILAAADVFDALTSDRPYRSGMTTESAVQIIKDGSGTQFDPKVVEAFLKVMAEQEIDKQL